MRRIALVLCSSALVFAMAWLRGLDRYSSPHNLHAVETRRIYRSGFQYPGALQEILDRHQIRTVIRLAPPDSHPTFSLESEILERRGITLVQQTLDRLSGPQLISVLNQTADLMDDESMQPVLIHCKRGIDRTGAAIAVYRMRRQGWNRERVHRELLENGVPSTKWPQQFVDQYWRVQQRRAMRW